MKNVNRRSLLKGVAAAGAVGAMSQTGLLEFAKAWAQAAPWKPEKGAKLTLLRWKAEWPRITNSPPSGLSRHCLNNWG